MKGCEIMSQQRTRKNSFILRLDDNEMRILQERMQAVGVKNREMFARKMLLDGYIINVDLKPIAELVRLTRIISNNINQVSHRANECGGVYEQDVLDLLAEVNQLKPLIAEAYREAISLCKH
jgi:hypothetical protein